MKRFLLALASVAGLACSDPAGPAPRAELTVLVATVHATTGEGMQPFNRPYTWMRFSVPVTIRNTGKDAITLSWCAPNIVRDSAETLVYVWGPSCAADDWYTGVPIPPGAERTMVYSAWPTVGGTPEFIDWNSPTVNGEYRIRLDYAVRSADAQHRFLADGHAVSNAFSIVNNP